MTTELHDLPIGQLADLIKARTLSPVELVETLIRRIKQYDAQTRAFITPAFDLARRRDRGTPAVRLE